MAMAGSYWQGAMARGEKDAAGVQADATNMMRGIQAYMAHDYVRDEPDYDVVYAAGEVRVFSKGGAALDRAPVLLIPSMINGSAILDLMPERSMFDTFYAAGLQPYLLDWGEAIKDAGLADFDVLFAGRLLPAIAALRAQHNRPVHLVGYCMGGTMAVAAARLSDDVAGLATIAAPWDFYHGALSERVKFWSLSILPSMADKGFMDVDWLQMLFSSLDESMGVEKFARFAALCDRGDQGSDEAALFVAVEDWLNDGVALPQGIARAVIQDWYFGNAPMRGGWRVCGQGIVPEEIDVPALVIASTKDRLVEYDSARALAEALPDAQLIDPECGHIGMIAGRRAKKDVWDVIGDWILGH